MLAVVKERRGDGFTTYRSVPEPVPGPGQVRVRVLFAGICGSDIHILHDDMPLRIKTPVVMGHEFVGRIEELGDGILSWKPGDLVVAETAFSVCNRCRMCRTGHDNLCADKELIGYVHDGAFASFLNLPVERLHRVPKSLEPVPRNLEPSELALLEPLAGCTHALMNQCRITPGDVVVVSGPGNVGLISVQVAKACGARVVLCGRSKHRLQLGERLGADVTVDVSVEDPVPVIRAMSDGPGCDVFIECSGAATSVELGLSALCRRGRYLQQGFLAGSTAVNVNEIILKELVFVGALGQKFDAWERAIQLLEQRKITLEPLISDILPLEQWRRGFAITEGRSGHKVLLQPDPGS